MSNYTKTTNFTAKDALASGDPDKLIVGAELDSEFDAIATAVATKANSAEVPTLAGTSTITGTFTFQAVNPGVYWYETDAGSDEKRWRAYADGNQFLLQARSDDNASSSTWLNVLRSGINVPTITFSNQYGSFSFSGDGTTQTLALNASSAADDASIDLKRNSTTYARVATVGTAGNVVNDSDQGDLVLRTNGGAIRLTTNSGTSTNVFVSTNNTLALRDGQTAPAALVGLAQIYVDTADGDLKVRFGDGTIKTIVVDT